MKCILQVRISKKLKTLIEENAKNSGVNLSTYSRIVLKNGGVLDFNTKSIQKKPIIRES